MASDGEISCTNDPNFAVIYSFLKVFGKLYGLDVPTITKLQDLLENTQEVLEPLKELHLRLLRRALKSVQSNRWERCLIKFCHQHGHHQEAWEIERFSYKKASTPVKLKVLKILLEYQFTCHSKFKSAVNAISCKELRPEPIGRDRSGCVYWLQVDHDANLCLYKEDQDEETWHLIARNREELVKIIAQLKSGEEICSSVITTTNEDSSSIEVPAQLEPTKQPVKEDDEEEFLSPESESEQEEDKNTKSPEKSEELQQSKDETDSKKREENPENPSTECKNPVEKAENPIENIVSPIKEKCPSPSVLELSEPEAATESEEQHSPKAQNPLSPKMNTPTSPKTEKQLSPVPDSILKTPDEKPVSPKHIEDPDTKRDKEEVSEAIEEPVMLITGEGNGAECESEYFIGEEISEPVMFFYGEGSGFENDTGNPEAIAREKEAENSGEENGNDECLNGENHQLTNSKTKTVKSVKLKSKATTVTKRSLKKQSTDSSEVLKPDTKKPCVRNDVSDSSNSNSKSVERELKREGSVNEKTTTDSESPSKNNVKKGRSKVKKKPEITRKLKIKEQKERLNSVNETDNGHDSKTSIIEKRKSSLSSEDPDEADAVNEKEKSPDKEQKVEDALPPKKLRLETTPESDTVSHSKETVDEDVHNNENKSSENSKSNSATPRKKIKASKGKFKRKNVQNKTNNVNKNQADNDVDKRDSNSGVKNKSLKRSLLDATMSDKNKSESQSESEDDEPVTSGKRLKIKPKKIVTSSRKKVEAKLQEKHSSDESEEETLYSIAGKKTNKKLLKRKPKNTDSKSKEKVKKEKSDSDDDVTPVRQSRRIAQLKIREEAERRHMEEVALREMKKIHKKKNKDDEEEWKASGKSSSESEARVRKKCHKWRASDSTGPEPDSESDEPLFEHVEPDLVFTKSDHEFSPESDLETGEPVEPLKRARTLQEEKDDGFCKRCGSGEQPEWILLCDKCDAGYHASCLKPMLFLVPEGDWFCPPCNHEMLIASLERELVKYDDLLALVQAERERKKLEEPEKESESETSKEDKFRKEEKEKSLSEEGSTDWSSSSDEGAVYRLRARKQLPVSLRAQEYDRLISSAIKEEYVEPTTSAGNQGRGKDISTIIEAAEEEKLKAEREAIEQGKPVEKKTRKKQRRKPRKLNSLDVPSEDDDDTDEDFKDTGMESSSEEISSSAERDTSTGSRSSDDLPIRRACRPEKKDRPKLAESSPEGRKKKKGVFADTSSESGENKDWAKESKPKKSKKREKSSSKKSRRKGGLTQYDAQGNVIRSRVTYGGLSGDEGENDWSPKHRTRQKKINYTEMPNTESEDEMHKSSGKHMPDSSDEFKIDDSDLTSDSDSDRAKRKKAEESERSCEEKRKALDDLIKKTAVVPLEKLSEEVTKAKTEELQAHLDAQAAAAAVSGRPLRGKGSRGGRGSRGPRGGGRGGRGGGRGPAGSPGTSDDALSKLVGVKIKDLKAEGTLGRPCDADREKKRQEREAKQAEKEAKRLERQQKREEKEKLKEQKAKEREEKRLARLALQETKRLKKEKPEVNMPIGGGGGMGYNIPIRGPAPDPRQFGGMPRMADYGDPRYPAAPRLQVRAELRGVLTGEDRLGHRPDQPAPMREGTLSVAGSPQPFKPITEEPSIITRMPHMINQQYRGPMMYPPSGSGYGARGPGGMYGPLQARPQYPPQYYQHLRSLPPYPPRQHSPAPHGPSSHTQGPHGPPQGPPVSSHGSIGPYGPPGSTHGPHGPPGSMSHGPPGSMPHGPPGSMPHGPPGSMPHGPPGSMAHGPPGAMSHGPPGTITHGPPGTMNHGPPGTMTHGPPGPMTHGPPGTMNHGRPGSVGPPASASSPHNVPQSSMGHGSLGSSHGHSGQMSHGQPGSGSGPHGPTGLGSGPHGPPVPGPGPHGLPGPGSGSHGLPGPGSGPHGPPGPGTGLQGPHGPGPGPHGPHGAGAGSHGPPGAGAGSHGPPGPGSSPHGPPAGSPHAPPGHMQHGIPRHVGPPGSMAHGPHGPMPYNNSMPHGFHGPTPMGPRGPSHLAHGVMPHPGLQGAPPPAGSPAAQPAPAATPPGGEPPIKIKAEVKTEPEYRSPPGSPAGHPVSPREEPPRNHPKIKHTDNKDRRPRYPLGPYAPQYGPYGPYAPPPPSTTAPELLDLQARLHPSQAHASPLQRMHQIHQFLPSADPRASDSPRVGLGERSPYDMSQSMPHYLHPHMRAARPHFLPGPRAPPPGPSSPANLPPHYPHYQPPPERMQPPPDRMQPPPDRMQPLPDRMHPPPDRLHSPLDRLQSPQIQQLPPVSQPLPVSQSIVSQTQPPPISQALTSKPLTASQPLTISQPSESQSMAAPQAVSVSQPLPVTAPEPVPQTDVSQPLPTRPEPPDSAEPGRPSEPSPMSHEPAAEPSPLAQDEELPPDCRPPPSSGAGKPPPAYNSGDTVNKPDEPRLQIKEEAEEADGAGGTEGAREEGSVFGGLVSYFSSQQEDDDT